MMTRVSKLSQLGALLLAALGLAVGCGPSQALALSGNRG